MDTKTRPTIPYGYRVRECRTVEDAVTSAAVWMPRKIIAWRDEERAEGLPDGWFRSEIWMGDSIELLIAVGATFIERIAKEGYELLPDDFEGKPEVGDICITKSAELVIGGDGTLDDPIKKYIAQDGDLAWLRPIKKEAEAVKESLTTQPTLEESRIKALEWMRDSGQTLFAFDPAKPHADFVNAIGCYAGIELEIAKSKASASISAEVTAQDKEVSAVKAPYGYRPMVKGEITKHGDCHTIEGKYFTYWGKEAVGGCWDGNGHAFTKIDPEPGYEIVWDMDAVPDVGEGYVFTHGGSNWTPFGWHSNPHTIEWHWKTTGAVFARPIPVPAATDGGGEVWPPVFEGWEFVCMASPKAPMKDLSGLHPLATSRRLGVSDESFTDEGRYSTYPIEFSMAYCFACGPLYRRIQEQGK